MIKKWSSKDSYGYSIVTGCDNNHEWMLKWWHNNYSKYNKHHIYFADFGMSNEALKFCNDHGTVIDLSFKFGKSNWFKKPMSILRCGASKIVWVDLDCEIRGNLDDLYRFSNDNSIGVTIDPYNRWIKNDNPVATGVVSVEYNNQNICEWAEVCIKTDLRGDQEVFNELMIKNKYKINIMPPEYQWLRLAKDNKKALIMHWTGAAGKKIIKSMIR